MFNQVIKEASAPSSSSNRRDPESLSSEEGERYHSRAHPFFGAGMPMSPAVKGTLGAADRQCFREQRREATLKRAEQSFQSRGESVHLRVRPHTARSQIWSSRPGPARASDMGCSSRSGRGKSCRGERSSSQWLVTLTVEG